MLFELWLETVHIRFAGLLYLLLNQGYLHLHMPVSSCFGYCSR